MRLHLQINECDNEASIWRTSGVHVHTVEPKQAFEINPKTKAEIDVLYKSGVTTAKRLVNALRDRADKFMPKRFTTDPDVKKIFF